MAQLLVEGLGARPGLWGGEDDGEDDDRQAANEAGHGDARQRKGKEAAPALVRRVHRSSVGVAASARSAVSGRTALHCAAAAGEAKVSGLLSVLVRARDPPSFIYARALSGGGLLFSLAPLGMRAPAELLGSQPARRVVPRRRV